MTTTRIVRHLRAPRAQVYRALLDAEAIMRWKVPRGMTSHVHAFDARVGGAYRVSLTYDVPTGAGKSSAHTDTYHGHFVELVHDVRVVEETEFETADPAMQGAMRITMTLRDAEGGAELVAEHANVPPGISAADNQAGWEEALDRLAELVEREDGG